MIEDRLVGGSDVPEHQGMLACADICSKSVIDQKGQCSAIIGLNFSSKLLL